MNGLLSTFGPWALVLLAMAWLLKVMVTDKLKSIMDTTERRVPVVARVMSLFPNAITALDEMLAAD